MHRAAVIILGLALSLSLAAVTQAETRRGDDGADTFLGTPQPDSYWGYGGNDDLAGRRAADHLHGGPGVDTLRGGPGSDRIHGGRGNDRVRAGSGADRLYGSRGNDRLRAGTDDGDVDFVDCGPGPNDYARVRAGDVTRNCETVDRLS